MAGTPRRNNIHTQEPILLAFDHGAPGQDEFTGVAAAFTLTCDTKANSTAYDGWLLNDGANTALVTYQKAGEAVKWSRKGSKATATLTCSTFADITNEDYFTIWDGHRFWKVMFDTDGSGDSTGTADLIVVVTGLTTAAQIVTAVVNTVQETTSIVGSLAETIHLTATDGAGDTVVFTCDFAGFDGNGTNTENMTSATFTLTAATGGTDQFDADEFAHVDISGATTAAQVATLVHAAINGLTYVGLTSVDGLAGVLTLTNDQEGKQGNADQILFESGATLMAIAQSVTGADTDESGATAAWKLFTAQRDMKLVKVEYVNPTGIAGHGSNYWEIGIKKGSTVMAQWSTDSDVAGQGTLAANTIVNPVLSATAANVVAAADDVISFFATKVASAGNLPPGRVVIHARYL